MKSLLVLLPLLVGCANGNTPAVLIEQVPDDGGVPPTQIYNQVADIINCEGTLYVGTSQAIQNGTAPFIVAKYQAVIYQNGDCSASGSISDEVLQASDTNYYPLLSDNWQVAPLSIGFSVFSPVDFAYWTLQVDRGTQALNLQVAYNDGDLVAQGLSNPYITVFPVSNCQLTSYLH